MAGSARAHRSANPPSPDPALDQPHPHPPPLASDLALLLLARSRGTTLFYQAAAQPKPSPMPTAQIHTECFAFASDLTPTQPQLRCVQARGRDERRIGCRRRHRPGGRLDPRARGLLDPVMDHSLHHKTTQHTWHACIPPSQAIAAVRSRREHKGVSHRGGLVATSSWQPHWAGPTSNTYPSTPPWVLDTQW